MCRGRNLGENRASKIWQKKGHPKTVQGTKNVRNAVHNPGKIYTKSYQYAIPTKKLIFIPLLHGMNTQKDSK